MLDSLDRRVVLVGAAWAVALAAPAAVATSVLGDTDEGTEQSSWVFVAFLVVVVAYLVGGAQAGRRAPTLPFLHGAAASFLAFAVIQGAGVVRRLVTGDGVSPVGLVFNGLLAASFGVVGASFGARRAGLDLPADPH